MDTIKLITEINLALQESDNFAVKYYEGQSDRIADTKYVLNLLRQEIQLGKGENTNERILRAMHDIGMSAFKEYENSPLEEAIGKVTGILYREIPSYKNLKPLRMDFGKGDPI